MLSKEELQSFNWKDVDVLIVNEGEGKDLINAIGNNSSNVDVLEGLDGLEELRATSWIVMTKGARGVSARVRLERESSKRELLDIAASKPQQVVDTTGAGDTFAGNLVAGLMRASSSSALSLAATSEILEFAALAAAMAVEVNGAMESIPRYEDVLARQNASQS